MTYYDSYFVSIFGIADLIPKIFEAVVIFLTCTCLVGTFGCANVFVQGLRKNV